MAIDLRGKPIAITGASSGIGAATALACARAGMPVALGARRVAKLEELVRTIKAGGGRAIAVRTDVANPDEARALVDAAVQEFGSLYAVFANAGYADEIMVSDTSDQQLRDVFETNFFGTMNVVRPALEHIKRNPGNAGHDRGHILICSSCLARLAIPYYGAYCATKAAQAHIGAAMRFELEPQGIHVSTVHPIGTKTEFFDQILARSGRTILVNHAPDQFMQTPATVAKHVVSCLRRPRPEVWTGLKGAFVRFGMGVCTIAPRLSSLTMRGMVKRRIREYMAQTAERTA